MAQVLKEDIEKRILNCAIDEFFKKDFRNANMRDIAKNAGIPTGLIYSYFKNKEDLFTAIVEPVYRYIRKISEEEADPYEHPFDNFFDKETGYLLTLLKANRKQFVILIDKSKGTKYESAFEDIVGFMQNHIKKHLGKLLDNTKVQPDDMFFHIMAHNFVEGFIEIARHYVREEWAQNMVKLLGIQYFYGVNAFI